MGNQRTILPNFFYLIITIFTVLIFVAGCGIWSRKTPTTKTPEVLFGDGMRYLSKKKYTDAAETFKRIKEEYPLSPLTPLAELRTADALYFDKNYPEAIVLYEEFKKLHPTHAEVPYVTYQTAMCHFKQKLSADRDQTETEKALEQFRYLIENFPQSKYVSDGKEKMRECLRLLAQNEFRVASFYYRKGNYKGALGRFEEILKTYPESGLDKKIVPLMQSCREKIARDDKKKKEKEEKEARKKAAASPPVASSPQK